MGTTKVVVSASVDTDPIRCRVGGPDDISLVIGEAGGPAFEMCLTKTGLENLARESGRALAELPAITRT